VKSPSPTSRPQNQSLEQNISNQGPNHDRTVLVWQPRLPPGPPTHSLSSTAPVNWAQSMLAPAASCCKLRQSCPPPNISTMPSQAATNHQLLCWGTPAINSPTWWRTMSSYPTPGPTLLLLGRLSGMPEHAGRCTSEGGILLSMHFQASPRAGLCAITPGAVFRHIFRPLLRALPPTMTLSAQWGVTCG
jgi:hypothetical protein